MNRWMANPDFVASCAHVLAGYAAIMTARAFWPREIPITAALFVSYAAWKEFWYDARYELPKQTWKDNLLDFSMYFLGVLIGTTVAYI
jgi:hypothetical protein